MELFKMGVGDDAIDFTTNITVPNFKVNRKPVTEEYTDLNYVVHRETVRQRIEGTFTLKFYSMEDETVNGVVLHGYKTFVDCFNNSLNGEGAVKATVYANNMLKAYEGEFYLDFQAQNTIPFFGSKSYNGFDVTIKER